MSDKYNQVVLAGHLFEKLIYSIDKEPVHKVT
ncbi:hypothetical protein LCGC14_1017960, partial [marine sediment metagenome]